MKLVIIIPAFNEAKAIGKVLDSLPKKIKDIEIIETVVVNDNSGDETEITAKKKGVWVLNHVLNRGAGAATKTGLHWGLQNNADILVTFDADGQHNARDIEKIIVPILKKEADLVIGSRFKKNQKVPVDRFILNWLANFTTFFFFGIFTTDSQSGLRALSGKAAKLINYNSDRMEFSSEILLEAKKHNLKIKEVPTSAIYTDYSRLKGQKNTNAFPIMLRFIVKILR